MKHLTAMIGSFVAFDQYESGRACLRLPLEAANGTASLWPLIGAAFSFVCPYNSTATTIITAPPKMRVHAA